MSSFIVAGHFAPLSKHMHILYASTVHFPLVYPVVFIASMHLQRQILKTLTVFYYK